MNAVAATSNTSHQTVSVHGRSLHCLRLGSGPAVVLLHESPRSSAVLLPLALALCDRFTVFAVDTPGYGASDPLPQTRPTIDDFADAIAASLAALGLQHFAVYGTHTGATIATALARRHPALVSGVILDGYPVFTRQEQDLNAYHYFPSFDVCWDGSHVAALWSRVRDQYTFFPWWQPGRDSRIPRTPPPLASHYAAIRDILSSSDYAAGYNAAFRVDGREALCGVSRPVHLICREDDTLFPHLARLGDVPATMIVERLGADRGRWSARIGDIFAGLADVDAPSPIGDIAGTPRGALVALSPHLLARAYDCGQRLAPPLVLIGDLPGQAQDWVDLARSEARRRQVFALELPGAGVSRGSDALDGSPDAMVDFLLDALDRNGIAGFDLAGRGLGGLLAQRLAAKRPGGKLLLLDPPPAEAADIVRPQPDWHGGHLLSLWYEARDAMLFRPPRSRSVDTIRDVGPGIDLAAMQRRFVCAVRSEAVLDALTVALGSAARAWPDVADAATRVVLRENDRDNDDLTARLRAVGARVLRASHDGLTAVAIDALA